MLPSATLSPVRGHLALPSKPAPICVGKIYIAASRYPKQPITLPRTRRCSRTVTAAMASDVPSLVSPLWLMEHLDDDGIILLDGTWYMPGSPNNPTDEFKSDRIPGSRLFLHDVIADTSCGLPHMLPSNEVFAAAVSAMGITNETHVVAYDRHGIFSAPRVWWTFRVFGHEKVSVLEGGLPAWKAAGGAMDTANLEGGDMAALGINPRLTSMASDKYVANKNLGKVRNLKQMCDNIESAQDQVVDARSAGRFFGTAPEPRPGMRGGHIPGSCSVPFDSVLKPDKSGYKSTEELRNAFSGAGITLGAGKPIVASCGSGMTACVLALALDQLKQPLTSVYDGSWMEWGSNQDVPVVKEG